MDRQKNLYTSVNSKSFELYDFQREALEKTKDFNRVAYYLDMGLGKTFVGSEKAMWYGQDIVVVCQKSKVDDWCQHFVTNYPNSTVINLTKTGKNRQVRTIPDGVRVRVINYDLIWRREDEFKIMSPYTLILDESSCIQNETSKRTRFITRYLKPCNVILLSGTPCNGKYENLWTQCCMLGYRLTKQDFWNKYIRWIETDKNGYPVKIVIGYRNVEDLKSKLRLYGAVFMKTDEVYTLPEQVVSNVFVGVGRDYKTFVRDSIVELSDDKQLVGSTPLTKLLYCRQLAGAYNEEKYIALSDMLESTTDRLIVFYNFDEELDRLKKCCKEAGRKISEVNGHRKDLQEYEENEGSVTLVQYQSGAMGLNLQKANKMIFLSPPLSCELYLQAFKRIHRIGQGRTCFYYRIIAKGTVEEKIYQTLEKREDYTLALFEEV